MLIHRQVWFGPAFHQEIDKSDFDRFQTALRIGVKGQYLFQQFRQPEYLPDPGLSAMEERVNEINLQLLFLQAPEQPLR